MAPTPIFDFGQLVRIPATLTVNGVPTDAATVSITVRTPAGVDTPYTLAGGQVVRDGVGQYHFDVSGTQADLWEFTWNTTLPQSAEHGSFLINKAML